MPAINLTAAARPAALPQPRPAALPAVRPPRPQARATASSALAAQPYRPAAPAAALRHRLAQATGQAIGGEVAALKRQHKFAEAEALLAWAVAQPQHRSNIHLHNGWLSIVRGDLNKLAHVQRLMAQRGLQHDVVACSILIEAYGRAGLVEQAIDIFEAMRAAGTRGDAVAYSALIKAFARANDLPRAGQVFDAMLEDHVATDAITYMTLVDMNVQNRDLAGAWRALQAMEAAHVVGPTRIYNTVMSGYIQADDPSGAQRVQMAMRRAGVAADRFTYNALLQLCAQKADVEGVQHIFAEMKAKGLAPDVVSYSVRVNTQCKAGDVPGAKCTMNAMRRAGVPPNVITYTTFIDGCAKAGDVDEAWNAFLAMEAAGIRAEGPSYTAMLDAFYNAGKYALGIQRLGPRSVLMPMASRAGLAELYRKAKRSTEALALCDQVLAATPQDSETHHHAWIVKRYVTSFTQPKKRQAELLAHPPFSVGSLHWERYLCLRVFLGIADDDDRSQIVACMQNEEKQRNVHLRDDLRRALALLNQ